MIKFITRIIHHFFPPKIVGWRCTRCAHVVNLETFTCRCTTSPSPWEPMLEWQPVGRW